MRYYRIVQSFNNSDGWFLGEPQVDGLEVDSRLFTSGRSTHITKDVEVEVRKPGVQLDVTLGDYDMPIFSERALTTVIDLIQKDVEVIPAVLRSTMMRLYIVNILPTLDCIDEEKSTFIRWTDADGMPNKVGQYRSIYELRIDPGKVTPCHIFRPRDWKVAILISEELAVRFLEWKITGISLKDV